MKNFILLIIFSGLSLSSYSQVWVEKDSIPAPACFGGSFTFSIGGKLYVGGGYDGTNYLSAFYQYDPATNGWTAMADVPEPIEGTYGFVLNGMGYVVCGTNSAGDMDSVFMYNPGTNTWSRKNNFPGGARQNNAVFGTDSFGYLFGGLVGGSALNDLWQYNNTTDSWLQLASCPGPGRDGPIFLVINGQIYIGMGNSPSGIPIYPDFYRFDPVANAYTQVDSMPEPRTGTAHFATDNLGYVGLGHITASSTYLSDFYIFDPAANTWTLTDSFGGGPRGGTYSETVNNVGYVGGGITYNNKLFRDCWSYGNPTGIHPIADNTAISCYPSPTVGGFTIDMSGYDNGDKEISIFDPLGQVVYQAISSQDKIQIGNVFSPGLYIVSATQNGRNEYARIVVQ